MAVVLLSVSAHAEGFDLYSETYRDFLSPRTINFQRVRYTTAPVAKLLDSSVYAAVMHERYVEESLFSFEVGVTRTLSADFSAHAGIRHMNVNSNTYRDIEPRLGLIGSHRWPLPIEHVVTEVYGELFVIAPFKDRIQLAGDGWANVRYVAYEKNHWILDAAVLEARTYRASNPAYAGTGYSALSLGPRASRWWENGASITLFVARRITVPIGGSELWDNWFLLTGGAKF